MSLTDVDHNLIKFNAAAAQGAAHSEIDWYRKAPEAWVKPGWAASAAAPSPKPTVTLDRSPMMVSADW